MDAEREVTLGGVRGWPAISTSQRFARLPFSPYHRRLAAVLATCYALDAVDATMLSFLLAPISREFGLNAAESAIAGSSVFAGMGLGAAVAGLLSDRFGRRIVLVSSMLFWGTASLLTAFSWNLSSFVAFRFLTGLGLGAELPIAYALVAEFMPSNQRARITGWMQVAGTAGTAVFTFAALMAVHAFGSEIGWRAMFVVMFAAALGAMYARRRIPESPRWLESRGQHQRADKILNEIERTIEKQIGEALSPPEDLASSPQHGIMNENRPLRLLFGSNAGRSLFVWALWLFVMLGFYSIRVWVGKLLVDRGMSISHSLMIGTIMSCFGIPAAWLVGAGMERIGRKPIIAGALVLLSAAAYLYGGASDFVWVTVAGCIMQFMMIAVSTSLFAYSPELFPTACRATGLGIASLIGRIASIVGPLLVPPLIAFGGYNAAFLAISVCFLFCSLLVIAFGPETKDKPIEEAGG